MIIYTCPKCSGDIYHTCICTMPPIDVLECYKSDWRYEVPDKLDYRPFEQIKIESEYEVFT